MSDTKRILPDSGPLPLDEECDFSGLTKAFCAHCLGHTLGDEQEAERDEDDDDFEVLATFDAQYSGRCIVDEDHKIKRGDRVGKVRRKNNPFIPIPGVVCKNCVRHYDRVPKE